MEQGLEVLTIRVKGVILPMSNCMEALNGKALGPNELELETSQVRLASPSLQIEEGVLFRALCVLVLEMI